METIKIVLQLIIGLGILNVWLLRFNRPSSYRGGSASNMIEEFREYGLPEKMVYLVAFIKVGLALLIIAGIWIPLLTEPATIGLAIMMLGAIIMHLKIKDSLKQTLPALSLLLLCILVIML